MDTRTESTQTTTQQPEQDVKQNITARYLKKASLQALLEKLFEGRTDFNIRMKDDQWCFTAPRKLEESEIDAIRDE